MNLIIDDSDHPLIIKVASIQSARMQVYFIDNEEYFQRKAIFRDAKKKFFKDNDDRTLFFCRGVLETVKKLGWSPDIIHCHGWMTSLIPLLIKTSYREDPIFKDARIVYSVYDDNFEETFHLSSQHDVSFQEAMQLAELMDIGMPSQIHIVAIEVSENKILSFELSDIIRHQYPSILSYLCRVLNNITGRDDQ